MYGHVQFVEQIYILRLRMRRSFKALDMRLQVLFKKMGREAGGFKKAIR